ncbi:olfactory receptor 52E4-like [Polyodon spathula]|uniref:olfactory receptor 52E4-like n=1 Tax=Polyodon spathula TaxID=7913 RepID=UPI001B7F5BC9|nr:olfactory receptor 52E4-like [Polyodon spathula]
MNVQLIYIARQSGQAIGRNLGALVVAQHQLWFSQARVLDRDKASLLNVPITPGYTLGQPQDTHNRPSAAAGSARQRPQQHIQQRQYHPNTFILIGFPGLESYQHWLTIPFSVMYILAIIGNILLICIVKLEPNLHTPMYTFLCVLAMVDIGLCTSTIPKMLQMFWQKDSTISFEGCFIQMFFIHVLSSLESSTLAAMAYDRYVAIYNPLLYTTILTKGKMAKIMGVLFARCFILAGLVPVLASMLPYCSANTIQHCFCEHMAVAKLACKDITMNSYYSLAVAFVIAGTDITFIIFTYAVILRAVSKLGSKAARVKAFNTCGSHLFVIMYFYTTTLFTFVTYRFGKNIPPRIHVMFAVLYLLVPPMLNPIVYGVKTKEIRQGFQKHFLRKKINLNDK